ncbi:MAG: hypothetical protein IJT06_07660 [Selenomonadaceae bacterium]|nr:hypothetical protein [Selenomonadaceae bacterium]
MSNYIYEAAIAFQNLLPVNYRIVIGRKKQAHTIILSFREDNFLHLSGFHKLNQFHAYKIKSNRFFHDVIDGKITDDTVGNYVSDAKNKNDNKIRAESILERVKALIQLEKLVDSNHANFFGYDPKNVRGRTNITKASYVIKSSVDETVATVVLSFLVDDGINERFNEKNFYVCSMFPLTDRDYTKFQTKYTLLLKEKNSGDSTKILYKHQNYNV